MKKVAPIRKMIKANRHTPQYQMHKYFARRPYNVFQALVSHYSNENDIILDPFCGGGVTVFEGSALARRVIGVDINPLAAFVTEMQLFNGDLNLLKNTILDFVESIKGEFESWYQIDFEDDKGVIEWTEWAYLVNCPLCDSQITLSEDNKLRNGVYRCKNNCGGAKGVKRIDCKPLTSIPIRVKYFSSNDHKSHVREVDKKCSNQILEKNYTSFISNSMKFPDFKLPLDWDRQLEDGLLKRGIIEYKDFFTPRNFTLNTLIFNKILELKSSIDKKLSDYLYFLFSSSLRYTNNMTRVTENWEGGKPTSMDKHAFWLPNQYIENNVIKVIENRASAILKGCEYSKNKLHDTCKEVYTTKQLKAPGDWIVINSSASHIRIPDESIDVVITDPPYGSNVQYAELSVIWNAWYKLYRSLDKYIYNDEEAVVNRKAKFKTSKSETDYENLLFIVFKEAYRVLKPNAYMVFTFNNKNIKVWMAMLKAVARAGFYLPENGIMFQDYIDSYKNTAHLRFSGNIHGDFIYSFQKCEREQKVQSELANNLDELIETTLKRKIYSLFSNQNEYSTTDLYQNIFASLVEVLMDFILEHLQENEEILKVEKYSSDFIEIFLKRHLQFVNNKWELKQNK